MSTPVAAPITGVCEPADLRVVRQQRQVLVVFGPKRVRVRPVAGDVLAALIRGNGRVRRARLEQLVWGGGAVTGGKVRQSLYLLNQALRAVDCPLVASSDGADVTLG
jgi:DNA-binding winged helix-turn-helix (wHTH) protein